ncbi:MAG TPA: hypothetical protein ENJ80_02955 [Gammaproteobacteria bacterium]|nr:hypothetical protein [Gammaproteobacteria bacterium]
MNDKEIYRPVTGEFKNGAPGCGGQTAAPAPQGVTEAPQSYSLQSDILQHARVLDGGVHAYVNAGERVTGFGFGGSESLTLFLEDAAGTRFVRKVLSEALLTAKWRREGRDVMLHPCRKARRQTEYLRSLPESVKSYFPRVLNVTEQSISRGEGKEKQVFHEYIYDMSFVPGIEIGRFVLQYQPRPIVVAMLYCVIFRLLREKVHCRRCRIPLRPTLESSYFNKIEQRMALARRTAPETFSSDLLESDSIIINNRIYRNLKVLLREFRANRVYHEILEPRYHSLVMGDTNTENIKIGNIRPLLDAMARDDLSFDDIPFTADELEIRFLDPRAIGFHIDGDDTCVDDPMYDNKPWHNSLGNYDMIHGEHFDLSLVIRDGVPDLHRSFHENNPYSKSYDGIGEYFAQSMTHAWRLNTINADIHHIDPHWLVRFVFLMGTHFMAMPPFHFHKEPDGTLIDTPRRQQRPLAIYAEGIIWLNLALDMLKGKVVEFHGVHVNINSIPDAVQTYCDLGNATADIDTVAMYGRTADEEYSSW